MTVAPSRSTGNTRPGVGIAVAPHHLAAEAGVEILRDGGNAVDAAIAVDAVLGVVLPDTCGPGGDLFAIVHRPGDERPSALNASGRAGSGIDADGMRDRGHGEIPFRSPWSITVPGCVDGWIALVDRFGSRPLDRLLAPAITLARGGFPVSAELASTLGRVHDMVGGQPSAGELYPDSTPPGPGDTLTRPAFAETLSAIAAGGRSGFYESAPGEGVARASRGAITAHDLAVDQAEWIDPISLELFGRTAWTIPPNSQGYLTLATLGVFSRLDPPTDPEDPVYQHLLVEAYRSVAWERADTVADARFAPIPPAELLGTDRMDAIAASIDRRRAGRWPIPELVPGGTAYMTVLDGSGTGVSFIQSNFAGIGSGISAGDTGVWLHNRGAGFNLLPGHPNEYAPGKRPLHTLSPTLWTHGSDLALLLGTRGGDQQPQYLAQFAALHLHSGLNLDDAQHHPRWFADQPVPGADSALTVESRMGRSTLDGLSSRGHAVTEAASYEPGWGPVSAIDVAGGRRGSADPRITTSAALAT